MIAFWAIHFTVSGMYRSMGFFGGVGLVLSLLSTHVVRAETRELGFGSRQMIVCLAPARTSFEGTLQLFDRDAHGSWHHTGDSWPVLFARNGLAWGRGLNPPQPGPQKISDDHRNPAGLFKVGFALGYAPALPGGSHGWAYHQVTGRDAWIDLPELPGYNHLYTLPAGEPLPAWWDKERLHLGDAAYEWMVLIEDNYDPAVPGAGTEIFFHVRRGEHYRTAGCTTMSKDNLERLIRWLRPDANPMLAELSRADYERFWKSWGLPPSDMVVR